MVTLSKFTAAIIVTLIFGAQAVAESLPEFSLKCSEKNSQNVYKLASNGSVVYFASQDSKLHIADTKKSINNLMEARVIWMSFSDSDADTSRSRITMNQDEEFEIQGSLARDTLALQIGKRKYACEKIADNTLYQILKIAYESDALEAIQRQKTFNERPNQL